MAIAIVVMLLLLHCCCFVVMVVFVVVVAVFVIVFAHGTCRFYDPLLLATIIPHFLKQMQVIW